MKPYIKLVLFVLWFITCTITSCTPNKVLTFANYEWHVDKETATLVNSDSTYKFCFGDCINPDIAVFNNTNSIAKYPGLDKYLYCVLRKCELGTGKILFFRQQRMRFLLNSLKTISIVSLRQSHLLC